MVAVIASLQVEFNRLSSHIKENSPACDWHRLHAVQDDLADAIRQYDVEQSLGASLESEAA